MKEIHYSQIGKRKLETMSANELRAICYRRGVDIPKSITTKKELIEFVKKLN